MLIAFAAAVALFPRAAKWPGADAARAVTDVDGRAERKRRARRVNERLKLASTFSNGLGIAFIATSVLSPPASGRRITPLEALSAMAITLILHVIGQGLLQFWKSED